MATLINRYPIWKYILICLIIVVAFLYAAPNLYREYPAVQMMGTNSTTIDAQVAEQVKNALHSAGIAYKDILFQDHTLLFRFSSTDTQFKAKEIIQQILGDNYLVALNLSPGTPKWLKSFGAVPMKLGLDLRGGVHFLLQVEVNTVIQQLIEGDLRGVGQALRDEHIRYSAINRQSDNKISVAFRTEEALDAAYSLVSRRFNEFTWEKQTTTGFVLQGILSPAALFQAKQDILEQA